MNIQSLILEFAQALGGISKHKRDFWILEVPMANADTVTVFFRLNQEPGGEALLVFFTQIRCLPHGASDPELFRRYLQLNLDLKYSRVALMGDRVVLLSAAGENFDEDILLEMVHEVVYAGGRLREESADLC